MRGQPRGHLQAGHQAAVEADQLEAHARVLQRRGNVRQRQRLAATQGLVVAEAVDGAAAMVPQRQGVLPGREQARAPLDEILQRLRQVHGHGGRLLDIRQGLQHPALGRARARHQAVAARFLHVDARVLACRGATADLQHHAHVGAVVCLEHVEQVALGAAAIQQVRGHQIHQQRGLRRARQVVAGAAATAGCEQAQQGQGGGVLKQGASFHAEILRVAQMRCSLEKRAEGVHLTNALSACACAVRSHAQKCRRAGGAQSWCRCDRWTSFLIAASACCKRFSGQNAAYSKPADNPRP